MKSMKKVIVALVVALSVMMGMSMLSFAAGSVTRTSISTGKATAKTVGYTGKNQKPKITVKNADGKTLKEGRDYKVTYGTYKKQGVYTVKITGIGAYKGTIKTTYTIKKTAKATVKATNKIVKSTKKNNIIKLTVKKESGNKGTVNYSIAKAPKGAAKYISVSKKGVITVKKGAPKGTYTVKVRVESYKQFAHATKTVKIKVK